MSTGCLRRLPLLLALGVALAAPRGWAEPEKPSVKEDGPPKLSKELQKVLELTNEARAGEKLPALKLNAALCKAAQAHSANMARQGKMEHVLDGKNPAQRVEAAGYDYAKVGENIAAGANGPPVEAIFKSWMESQHHKDNILNPKYQEIGLGLAADAKGEVYYTQVFATPRKKR
jgi:uncharacterized protein YkwD